MLTPTESPDEGSLIEALARHVMKIRSEEIPSEAREQASLCILDTLGCMVAGSVLPEVQTFIRSETEVDTRGQASVVGHARKLSVDAAMRVNGYMGDLLELNDLIGGHASIGVVPPALALAEATGASGAQLLTAVIAGIETTARVYYGYYPGLKPFTEVGMSAVGFPSTIGAAAAVATLLGLTQAQTAHAMANAGALAGWCPAEVIFGDGGSIKPMLFGACPGSAALAGARYARAGVTGPLRLLESPIGFFATTARTADAAAVRDTSSWHVAQPRRKLHACCGYMHSAIDTLVAMRHEGVRFNDAASIVVQMPGYVLPAVSKAAPPSSTTDALFHAQYCMALAICGHDTIAPEHALECATLAARDDVASTMQRIRIEAANELTHYHQCRVQVMAAGGQVVASQACSAPKGSAANPMSNDEVKAKFRALVKGRLPRASEDEYIRRVERLASEAETGWLTGAFSRG